MSAILALVGFEPSPRHDVTVSLMTEALRVRGRDVSDVWRGRGAHLAVCRNEWEVPEEIGGPARVAHCGDQVGVTDASLYYRADLRKALVREGHEPEERSPSALISASYRAWGTDCVSRLEGDFAFAIWDAGAGRLFAARDFAGKRPLYYSIANGRLMLASTATALLAHPDCSSDLDPVVVGAAASGLWTGAGHRTCYRSIRELPAGSSLIWSAHEKRERVYSHADLALSSERSDQSFNAAADELRHRLQAAVRERMTSGGQTGVWMSGGYDSTAVFAAGRGDNPHASRSLSPVSIAYSQDHPAREDELISQVSEYCSTPVHWCDVGDMPLLAGAGERAATRQEPLAHVYETQHRAFAAKTAELGMRVVLDGNGGDQLFTISDAYLANLFWSGRWRELRTEWEARGGHGLRSFFHWSVKPGLPHHVLRGLGYLRGGPPLSRHLDRRPPPWIRREFLRAHDVLERDRSTVPSPSRPFRGIAEAEAQWYLTSPYLTKLLSLATSFALESGVELRSPLLDQRIVSLVLARPLTDRAYRGESKRLLRRAMKDLLPASVLARRRARTGVATSRSMARPIRDLVEQMLRSPVHLADMGIVDVCRLRRAAESPLERDTETRLSLFFTVQTELWLRGRGLTKSRAGPSESASVSAAVA